MYNERSLEVHLRNMTTRELIKYCEELNDDPTVRELAKRLELCLDFARWLECQLARRGYE